jgi:hypothetical protein
MRRTRCPDCETSPGRRHLTGCGVARPPRSRWSGEWPGAAECRRRGWYARPAATPTGWAPCPADALSAAPDLLRLAFFEAHGVDGLYEVLREAV